MVNKIELSKSLPREQWGEFFDQFSDGNRGRHLLIEIIQNFLVKISRYLSSKPTTSCYDIVSLMRGSQNF